ncbi:cubilin homolog [Drosophila gunungcola]|uniref:cubilin homolog n=1 Tax=Drosophila gunungcola TaxID=103775 RepID=UPI0022E92D75|nr:cubilin homolog [Drosophila gunungcola]
MPEAVWTRLQMFLVIFLITDTLPNSECFVNSPSIISRDGNLIFASGVDRNISILLSGNSRLTINEEIDVLDLLMATGEPKTIDPKTEWNSVEKVVRDQLEDQLNDFQMLAFGPKGLSAMLDKLLNSSSVSEALLERLKEQLRVVENFSYDMANLECKNAPCQNGGKCVNNFTSYYCECPSNFEGTLCEVDVNECALYEGTDLGCQNGAECHNRPGSYSCLCAAGWHGMHCTQRRADCLQSSSWELCGHGSCVPSSEATGYRCLCDPGWTTNGLTPACDQDVDECSVGASGHAPCSTKCINLPGSFTCSPCPVGLTGNGWSCQDLDECQTNNGGCSLHPKVQCINTYGSHHCGECPMGWTGDGLVCERIPSENSVPGETSYRSCPPENNPCHPVATCQLLSGSASCSCPMGMMGTGYGPSGCRNESTTNCQRQPCLNNGICREGPSNFTCLCPQGFRPPICEPESNKCDPNPCQNMGICSIENTVADGFVCQCFPGYIGHLCSIEHSACNDILSAERGRLKYPPKGGQYEHNSRCGWLIQTNESLVLNVTFHSFDLEDSTECRFDWLQINDGKSKEDRLIGRYCGAQFPNSGNIVSSGNQLSLRFHSDNATAKEGFDLTWNSIEPQCGGKLDVEESGTLYSPGSPGNYLKSMDCLWHLVAPMTKRIKLTFISFQLEEHDNCNFDFVLIKDSISGRELVKFCSSGHPEPLILPTHRAEIEFHSDAEGSDAGFRIHYSAVDSVPGCGGSYTAKMGTISASSAVGQPTSGAFCEYEIHLAAGEQIVIQFVHLELGTLDCVELIDEDSTALRDKICGSDAAVSNPPSFTSQSNRVMVKFYAAAGSFELNYRMSCDFTLDSNTGTLTSPGYPSLTRSDRLCTYTIKTPSNTLISVKLIDFELKSTENDDEDYENDQEVKNDKDCSTTNLKIIDGLNRQILGPYCSKNKPQQEFISRTNYLQYQLTTDADSTGRGFKFEYEVLSTGSRKCGGVHTTPGDHIRLPDNPDDLCYWVILAPPKKAIRLHWNRLRFASPFDDCTFGSIEIFDSLNAQLTDAKNTSLGRFCHSRSMPDDLVSHSNHLVIKYSSFIKLGEDLFELSYSFEDRKECGGHIHGSSGELSSPGYPMTNYSSSLDCDWHLTGPFNYQLEIEIDLFDLEYSPKCTGDYLEVRNGGGTDSPLIGRFCGRTITTRIPSFGYEFRLLFHTDSAISGRGFHLRWRQIAIQCGGHLPSNTGVILSPRYPNAYPAHLNCKWWLSVHPGSGVSLLIEDINILGFFLDQCVFESLKIYSGFQMPGDRPAKTICKRTMEQINLNTSQATVVFHSDSYSRSHSHRGFRISYTPNCVQNLTAPFGTIESVNYMELNWENMLVNCRWTIRAPKGNHIRLEVSHLQHLPGVPPVGLYIIDGRDIDTILSPGVVDSKGDLLTIVHNASSLNFQLDYQVVGCLESLYGENGTFHSPNHPKMYPNNMECYWLIEVVREKAIELTITDLDIEESVNCTKDALTVSDHKTEMLADERHCGSRVKLVLTSSGHRMHVHFVSDGSHNGRGFNATYRTVEKTCGGKISTRNRVIQLLSDPVPFLMDARCEWQVEAPPHHSIVFEVQNLDSKMWEHGNCTSKFIEAFDLTDDDTEDHMLFKICNGRDEFNTSIVSTTNRALVRYFLYGIYKFTPFRLHFHESCGQTVIIRDTDLKYIQLAHQPKENESCVWVLQAQEPSNRIIFTPTHIRLRDDVTPTEDDCVKIYEGTEVAGTPSLQYCRSHPPAFYSEGQALTINVPLQLVDEFEANFMIMDATCGSVYTAISGRFSSPHYPDSYPPDIECIWELKASQGNALSLTLESMRIEESEGCNRDYLEVREGSARGNLIGVYCGSQVPSTIHSRSSIWMKFKSDDANENAGFIAFYNYERNNNLNGDDGIVESPHFPSKFDGSYLWRISVDEGYLVVVTVLHLKDVDQPHLRFYDGFSADSDQIEVTDPEGPIQSSGNVICITANGAPFRLRWHQLSTKVLHSETSICANKLLIIDQTAIDLHSPGYPNGYEHDLSCSCILKPLNPAEHAIIKLVKVDLEVFSAPGIECLADYLKISSSSDFHNWSELSTLCSFPSESSNISFHGKPYLRVEFNSDASFNQTGFNATVNTACGSHIKSVEGRVNITEVLQIKDVQGSSQECEWTLEVRQGRRIKIDFPESQFQNSGGDFNHCDNFLVLHNGLDQDSPVLGSGKYCDNNIQGVLETSSNRAYVKLQYVGTPRFRVTFRFEEVDLGCSAGIELSADGGEEFISSPAYPDIPKPHTECMWTVRAPIQHRIVLNFEDKFDLDSKDSDCLDEYVQVFDGRTTLSRQIGRFCGNRKPDTIYSSGNQLKILYYTDILNPHMGFKASLRLARCGGSYHSPDGVITSPPPNLLLTDSDEVGECVYTINLESDHHIELNIEYLEIPEEKNGGCSMDNHLLLEGANRTICGHTPQHLYTDSNMIVIRYRYQKGTMPEGQGFRFRYKSVRSRCSETIVASQGVLISPDYPEGPDRVKFCDWHLEVPKGQRVRLEVLDFNMKERPKTYAYLGRYLEIANDRDMLSIIWNSDSHPPAVIESYQNTMSIKTLILPLANQRIKMRFSAFGTSSCQLLEIEQDQVKELAFQGVNLTQPLFCSYNMEPALDSTILLRVKQFDHNHSIDWFRFGCFISAPLRIIEMDGSEWLEKFILCAFKSPTASQNPPSLRVPFPIQVKVSVDDHQSLQNLVLEYSMQACGGVITLEVGQQMTIEQPSGMDAIQGAVDCAWLIRPPIGAYVYHDILLEVLLQVSLPTSPSAVGSNETDCSHHYLKMYEGPHQSSELLGTFCNQTYALKTEIYNGIFLEYHSDYFTPNATFNVTITFGSVCGGKVTPPYRDINFRDQYKNNVECIWEVEAESGYHIGLTFHDRFYIEESSGCTKDYLLVQQRKESSGNWTDLQRICGRSPPEMINTTTTYLRLIFRSDGNVLGDGFAVRFEVNCGGVLYADEKDQQLTSPYYTSSVKDKWQCSWTIVPRNPSVGQGVQVSFSRRPDVCEVNELTMYMRDAEDNVKNTTVCNSQNQINNITKYTGRESISLFFRYENLENFHGFILHYSTIQCGGVISTAGVIESSQMPENDCLWNLTAPEGHKIIIKFELLDINSDDDARCVNSGVEVYAGSIPKFENRLVHFCGRISEDLRIINIAQNGGLIRSYSRTNNVPSFRVLVNMVPNCDQLIQLNGSLSYNYEKFKNSEGYASNLDCQIVFRVNNDQQIGLQFNSFHVQQSANCNKDYVELRDGSGPFADIIGRFCGQDLPPRLNTTRNNIFLRFVTDAQVNDSGFNLTITAIPWICGKPYIQLHTDRQKEVTITSPLRPPGGNYDNACYWRIMGESPLIVRFVKFDLQGPDANGSCVDEYLKIYSRQDAGLMEFGSWLSIDGDRSSKNGTEHVYCGNMKPDTYHGTDEMYIRYQTNGLVPRSGFQLQISMSSICDRVYGGLQGRIRQTAHCDINIQAPVNHTLSLYINKLRLDSVYCYNYLWIYAGRFKFLKKFCPYEDEGKALFSHSDRLTLNVNKYKKVEMIDITYLATPADKEPGCGGHFYNFAGVFTNPYYPVNVRNNSDCRWTVRVPSNNKVLLDFSYINLGSKSTCQTDYLQILEKENTGEEHEMRRFCGEDDPKMYKSQRNEVVVHFHKTVNFDGTGWVIRFSGVYSNYRIPNDLLP